MIVEVEFSIGSNDYKIIRGIKPAIFEIYQNNSLVNQSAEMLDYQDYLEKNIIKVNHKSFCQVVVLGTASFKPFMQLTTAQRREVIEDILNLQIFTTMNVLLKEHISENNEIIKSVTYDKSLVEEKIKITKKHLDSIKQNNVIIVEEKNKLIEKTERKIVDIDLAINEIENKRNSLEEKILIEEKWTKKRNKIIQYKLQFENKISTIKNEIDFFNHAANCPTCLIQQCFLGVKMIEQTENILLWN